MGIIRNLKGHYRSGLLQKVIIFLDNDETNITAVLEKINLLDVVYLLSDSWDMVKTTTVQNCFQKGGFKKEMSADLPENHDPLSDVIIPSEIDRVAFEQMVDLNGEEEIFENLTDSDLLKLAASERSSKSYKISERRRRKKKNHFLR